jgi:hypothetical protein
VPTLFVGCLASTDQTRAAAAAAAETVAYAGATATEVDSKPGEYVVALPAPAALGAYAVVVRVGNVRAPNAIGGAVLRAASLSEAASTAVPGPEALPIEAVVFVQSSDAHGSPVPFAAGSLIASVTFAGAGPHPTVNHTFAEVSPGYYRAALASATAAGKHRVDVVSTAGEPVGSVIVTVYPSSVSAVGSDLASLAAKYSAGAPGRFYVFARDAWGNRVTSAARLAAAPPRFGVTVTRADGGDVEGVGGVVAGAPLKVDAVDVGGGAYLVSFTAASEPNVAYAVAVALCPALNITAAASSSSIGPTAAAVVVEASPAAMGAGCYGGIALTKAPWTFATVGGTLRSTCYRLTGDYLTTGFAAGWALFKVVFFPSATCGQQPPGPEPIYITWTRRGAAGEALSSREVLCEAPRLDGAECRLRVEEPVAGTYQVNASLFGDVLAGAPASLVVKPAAPALRLAASPATPASASRLVGIVGLPANAPVPAGERLKVEVALVDRHGNPVFPDVRLFFGLTATLTTVVVDTSNSSSSSNATNSGETAAEAAAAAAAAATESIAVALEHVGGGVYRGVAPAVTRAKGYTLKASVFVFDDSGTATKAALEPAPGALLAVDVTAAAPDPSNFVYLGTGTAPTAVAGSALSVAAVVRDRFGNLIIESSKLTLAAGFSNLLVVASDPQVAARDDGKFTTTFSVTDAAKGELTAAFSVSAAGDWIVSVVSKSTQSAYISRALSVLPGELNVPTALVFNVLGGVHAPAAGDVAAFSIQLRDSFGNGIPAVAERVSFEGSSLVGSNAGARLTFNGGGLTLEPRNEQMGVYDVVYRTTVADTYLIRLYVQGEPLPVLAPNDECPVKPAALSPARSTVKGAAKGTAGAEAGAEKEFYVTPRDVYGNIRTSRVDPVTVVIEVDATGEQLSPVSAAYVGGVGIEGVAEAEDYKVTFRSNVAGSLVIRVGVGASAAAASPVGAPFNVAIAAAATSASHSRITGRGLGGATTGQSRDVSIEAHDRYGNPTNRRGDTFVATLDLATAPAGSQGTLLAIREESLVAGQYVLSFTLPVTGVYKVYVNLKDQATGATSAVGAAAAAEAGSVSAASPLVLGARVAAGLVSPAMSAVSGFDGSGVCGEFRQVTVEARDASGFPLNVGGSAFTLTADNELPDLSKSNVDNKDGTYTLSFTTVRSGIKALRLFQTARSNSPVNSDWTVLVGGPLAWPKNVVFNPAPTNARLTTMAWSSGDASSFTAEAGVAAVAVITARDKYGNEQVYGRHYRADPFTAVASLAGSVDGATNAVMAVAPGNDAYHASLTLLAAGEYVVRVSFDGADVGEEGAPGVLQLSVDSAGVSFALSVLTGQGGAETAAGARSSAAVIPRDAYGNPVGATRAAQMSVCRANVTNAAGFLLDVPCVPNDTDGVLAVSYNLTAVGDYVLSVYLAATTTSALGKLGERAIAVRGSAPSAGACTVTGVRAQSTASQAVAVAVMPRDSFGNVLSGAGVVFNVFASGPSGDMVPSPTPVYHAGSGEYRTTYGGGEGAARGLVVPGVHALFVTLGGAHVVGSPFNVAVAPAATSAAKSVVTLPSESESGGDMAVTANGAVTPIPLTAGKRATVKLVTYAENGRRQVIPSTGALAVSNIAQVGVAFDGAGASLAGAAVSVAENTAKGYYTIELQANKTSALTLNVTIAGVHVKGWLPAR